MALLTVLLLPACEPGQLKEGLAPDDNAVVSVSVTADRTAIVVGETVLIRASAQGTGGESAPAEVDWSADGGNLVPVTDSTATFSAPIAGAFKVRGRGRRNRNAQDSTTITVSQPVSPIVDVAVSPKPASLTFGQVQAFVATASRQDGTTLTPSVTWAATGGTITTAGIYTAGTAPGTFRVVATEQGGGLADTSAVTVSAVPPTLQAIVLNPASATLFTGGTRQFSASGQWSDGSTSAPAVSYSATGGTVTATGLYTGGATPGTFRVIATQQGGTLADTAAITLTAPVLQAVVLSPSSAALGTGATQQFSVSGQWSNGATTPPAVSYAATGGSITTGGLYTAGSTAGTFRVIATQQGGTLADTSVVTLSTAPPVLQAVVLTPASASVIAGTTRQFAVSGQWSDGSTTAPAVTYSATGGTISSGGLYSAGSTPGAFRVIATQQGGNLADTAAVTVTAPVLQAVILTPATASLFTGGSQQFSVAGQWSNGSTSAPAVTYTATGGTITAGGLYTGGSTPGAFRVIATQQGGTLADTATVNLTAPVLQGIVLSPASSTVTTGGTQQFTVTGQWSNGATTAPAVTYSATGGTISNAGLFTAGGTIGTFRVIATQQGGPLADSCIVIITAPGAGPYPNRPSNYTTIVPGLDLSQAVPTGGGNERYLASPNNAWSVIGDADGAGGSNYSRITDPTAPASPADVWQLRFASGSWTTGHGVGYLGRPLPSVNEVYVSFWIKWDPGFEWNSISTKLVRLDLPTNSFLIQARHGSEYLRASDEGIGQAYEPQVGTMPALGVWHQIEILIKRGSPGTIKVWLDGQLRTSYTNQSIRGPFSTLSIDGHLGGGGMTKVRDSFYWLDDIFIATP